MYEYIRGVYQGLSDGRAVLEAGGIGWSLSVTPATMAALPSAGGECQIYLVHIQREDAQELYGFHSRFERGVFRRLMTVSGIGPKQSLRILSGLEAAVLVRAIAGGDVRLLSSVPGLGKKTAEKLVFELQDKLDDLATGEMGPEADSVPGQTAAPESSAAADAHAALLSLGFSPVAARAAVQAALRESGEGASVQDLITKALRHV